MEQTKEINLQEVFYALLRKIWLIVLCAAVMGGSFYVFTWKFIKPRYQASVTIYVNNSNTSTEELINTITSADLSTSQKLVTTYVTILKSDTVLDKVAQEIGGNLSAGQIRGMITAAAVDKTEVFEVKISNTDPVLAAKIANTVAAVAPSEISNIVEGSSTKIIDYAKVPGSPYTPNRKSNTMIGAALGGILAVIFIVLQVILDVRIKSEEDLALISSAPVLGMIPDFEFENKSYYQYNQDKSSGDKNKEKESEKEIGKARAKERAKEKAVEK